MNAIVSHYAVAGTNTGRLASRKLFDQYGGNLQNKSDEERRLFIPRPGMRFGQNDLEGAEAVAVALYVPEGNFHDCIRRKVKIHNFVCIKLFPEKFSAFLTPQEADNLTPAALHSRPDYKQIVAHCKTLKTEYDLAKRTVHGSNYAMGWKTFIKTVLKGTNGRVVLDAPQAKRMLASYFELFPELKFFQTSADEAVRNFTPLTNLLDWSIVIKARYTTALGRTAVAWRPQSTIGLLMLYAAVKFQDALEAEQRPWNLLTPTHDSGLVEAPADEIVRAVDKLAECMTFELVSPLDGSKWVIGVERSVGDNWGKWSEDNPNGLRVI